MIPITLDTVVEQLIDRYPSTIEYGIMNGVKFFSCVGPCPTTLGELLVVKKIADPQAFVDGLNEFLRRQESECEESASDE